MEARRQTGSTRTQHGDQVEVLKGPQLDRYGGQALGVAIISFDKKPQGNPGYDFFYRGGRWNLHRWAAGDWADHQVVLYAPSQL